MHGPLSSGFEPSPCLFSSNHFFASVTAAVHSSGDAWSGELGEKLPGPILILESATDSGKFRSRLKERHVPVKSCAMPAFLLGISSGFPYSWASGTVESLTLDFISSTILSHSSLQKVKKKTLIVPRGSASAEDITNKLGLKY